jgi:hypothetical protein
MKQPHTTPTEIDLTVPVDPTSIVPTEQTDCFGTEEYNPQDKDCSLCSDIEICGIKFQELIKTKKVKVETEKGPMLDQSDIDGVNFKKIEKLANKYYLEGDPMTHEELIEAVMIQANTKDEVAALELIRREMPGTNMVLKDGKVYVR